MMKSVFERRRAASIALALGILIGLLAFTNNGPFIKTAEGYAQEITRSSAGTYLSLRLINAAISFAEEVEVGGSIIAVNGSAHPFKVLEPIDDAVERLSAAIFLVGAVSGVLSVILPILGDIALVFLGISMAIPAALDLIRLNFPGKDLILNFLQGVARLGRLGFLVVIAFSVSSWFADGVSDRAWGEYQLTLTHIAAQMPSLSPEEVSPINATQPNEAEDLAELVEPETTTLSEEETGFLARIESDLGATGRGAANIASSAASGVREFATSAFEGVKGAASSATESYTKATDILTILTSESDDLVLALMGVFAAFLFKTAICPALICIVLWKTFGSINFTSEDGKSRTTKMSAH